MALAIIGQVFRDGFVKNKTLEFAGPGVSSLTVDFRNGVDVMMTESSALFTIWETDDQVRDWLAVHGRGESHRSIGPGELAYYDCALAVNLSEVRPMIALPFHPSNAYPIQELLENLEDILRLTEEACNRQMEEFQVKLDLRGKIQGKRLRVDQGEIAGCAGGLFENIAAASDILRGRGIGSNGFQLNIYPASQPVLYELVRQGAALDLLAAGANLRSAFCGPCFGAGDVPANGGLSIRHTTRNFSNREGSQPGRGQVAAVALMDARSIAATAANGGLLTPATEFRGTYTPRQYCFHPELYRRRVLDRRGQADPAVELVKGPGIGDIPRVPPLGENLLVRCAAFLTDPVTTTDELIPNGESSSYRSNFEKIAEYTLSAKAPEYVGRCRKIQAWQKSVEAGKDPFESVPELAQVRRTLEKNGFSLGNVCIGSVLYANCPGDGSAREYAASNQRVLGGWANICRQYATKRYRSNLVNWGILPFTYRGPLRFGVGSFLWIPGIRSRLLAGEQMIPAYLLRKDGAEPMELFLEELTEKERRVIADGGLINHYRKDPGTTARKG